MGCGASDGSIVPAGVPEDLLGRVTSVIGSASAAMTPVGALLGGVVAEQTSTMVVLWAAGGGFALLATCVFVLPGLRRLPEVGEVSSLGVE